MEVIWTGQDGSQGMALPPTIRSCLKTAGVWEGGVLSHLVATCIVYAFACRPTLGAKGRVEYFTQNTCILLFGYGRKPTPTGVVRNVDGVFEWTRG